MTICKNCDTNFEGNYCPQCGQSATVHRYTIRHIFHEFFHAFTHADKSIFVLLKKILLTPGHLAIDLFAGKRKKYFNVFTCLVIIATIFVLIEHLTGYFDGLPPEQGFESGLMRDAYEFTSNNNKVTFLLFLPITTFLTWILFRKQHYNIAEHLVYNTIMISGEAMILALLFMPIFAVVEHSFIANNTMSQIVVVVYRIVGNHQVFKEKWIWVILKTIGMKLFQIVLFWLLLFAAIFIYKNLFGFFAHQSL